MQSIVESHALPALQLASRDVGGLLRLRMAAGALLLAGGWVLTGSLSLHPLWIATLRVLPAGVLILALRPAVPHAVWWYRSVVLGILNFGGFFTLQALAVQHLAAGVAATLAACQALLVPFGAIPLLHQRIRAVHIALTVLGVVGTAMLLVHGGNRASVIGVGAALGTATCTATGLLLTKYWGTPAGVHHMSATGWQMTAGGLALLPCAALTCGLPTLDARTVSLLAAMSVLGTAAAFAAIFGALHAGLPANSVSRLMLLCPIAVTVTDCLVHHQHLSWTRLVGLGLVLVSVTTAVLRGGR